MSRSHLLLGPLFCVIVSVACVAATAALDCDLTHGAVDDPLEVRTASGEEVPGEPQRECWEDAFAEYVAWRERELATNPSPRYLVARLVHTGLGNRLEGLASAFVTALLTGRVFAVDWAYTDEETSMLANPTLESTALQGPALQWAVSQMPALRSLLFAASATHLRSQRKCKQKAGAMHREAEPEPVGEAVVEAEECAAVSEEEAPLFWSMRGSSNAHKKGQPVRAFACGDLRAAFAQRRLVVLKANKFFGNFLAHNPHLAAEMAGLFGAGVRRRMFPLVLRSLVSPLPQVQAVIDHFAEEHFSGRHVVALQVRAREQYVEPGHLLDSFFESALAVAPAGAVFFVATDLPSVLVRARRALGPERVCHLNTAGALHGPTSRLNSPLDSVVTDLWLLAKADSLVTTCGSSFGRVATALTAHRKHIVVSGRAEGVWMVRCVCVCVCVCLCVCVYMMSFMTGHLFPSVCLPLSGVWCVRCSCSTNSSALYALLALSLSLELSNSLSVYLSVFLLSLRRWKEVLSIPGTRPRCRSSIERGLRLSSLSELAR
jgi:Xyloglucan fucosyltransferase